MIFYNYIFAVSFCFMFLYESITNANTELVYSECGLVAPNPKSIGLVFFVKINNTSDRNDYYVEITPDECCLEEEDEFDCDSLQIIDGCTDNVSKGETSTVKVIAPLLNQYERKGYCALYIDSKSNNGEIKRDTVKIDFDTTFYTNKFDVSNNYKHCEHKDEDPFNDCKPVNCDTNYNGKKSYYSRKLKRCVAVPPCISDDGNDYPSIIYDPQINRCIEESIVNEDLEYIENLRIDDGKNRKSKDILIENKFNPNTLFFNKDIDDIEITTKYEHHKIKVRRHPSTSFVVHKIPTNNSSADANCLKLFLLRYFINNKWALLVLIFVVILQCFLICTMIYCLLKSCTCYKEKKLIRNLFNYRQDVSVMTPLINTSNMDTETTEYQYVSESSNNVDQKIKSYKACQKGNDNNVKISMSDDILSKLLNRRDWSKYKPRDNPKPENDIEETIKRKSNQVNNLPKAEERTISNETKVIIEDEKANNVIYKKQTKLVNVVNDADTFNDMNDNREFGGNVSSEKEIKCHNYNNLDSSVAEYRATLAMNKGTFKDKTSKKGTASISTEKGAQAYFSNDSVDDFLSERGIIYLAGENMSKYTFSSGSNDMKRSVESSGSSKTSKNFVKNVLSLLRKRSKQSPSSDPGQNKDNEMQVIHMSRASVYSSTNDSDCIKNLKRKDSRTSF